MAPEMDRKRVPKWVRKWLQNGSQNGSQNGPQIWGSHKPGDAFLDQISRALRALRARFARALRARFARAFLCAIMHFLIVVYLVFIGGQDILGFFLIVIKLFSIPFAVKHLRDRDYLIS